MTTPTCWIIAGPNGAGKTTFALQYLPTVANCRNFINADLIAAGLAPLAPETELLAASRLFLGEIAARIQARQDFAFETTLSGRSYLKLIDRLKAENWRTELIYLALPTAEISQLRVAERVRHGGHNIPAADIARRFPRSLRNLLNEFSYVVDYARCFMNDGRSPTLIFEQRGETRKIANPELYQQLIQEAAK
jgi:predicted ABC-type ATPase